MNNEHFYIPDNDQLGLHVKYGLYLTAITRTDFYKA
jgi:hypothetical protein